MHCGILCSLLYAPFHTLGPHLRTRALHQVPIPMPMGFEWAWMQCYCSWVGMDTILLFSDGHGCDIIDNIIGNVTIFEYMGAIWIAWVGMGWHMSCYGWAWVGIGRCWWVWSRYRYKFESNVGLYLELPLRAPPPFIIGRLRAWGSILHTWQGSWIQLQWSRVSCGHGQLYETHGEEHIHITCEVDLDWDVVLLMRLRK